MKLYFADGGYGDNYIVAECSDGIRTSNCGGLWGGVDLYTNGDDRTAEMVVEELRDVIEPDIGEPEVDWMGDPCLPDMDALKNQNDAQEPFARDTFYFIGEYPAE